MDFCEAVVGRMFREGSHLFAEATPLAEKSPLASWGVEGERVNFSLEPPVWDTHARKPREGDLVWLEKLRFSETGWMARAAMLAPPRRPQQRPPLRVMQGPLAKGLPLPFYAYEADAGLQLPTAVEVVVPANGMAQIVTDLYFVIPRGYYLHVESRGASAVLGVGFDLTVVDEGYRGPLNMVAWNKSSRPVLVERGSVVGQVILRRYEVADVVAISQEDFAAAPRTERGVGRIGSSGHKPRYLEPGEFRG